MKQERVQQPPWYLEPYPDESVSHYFGRFRRQEIISVANPGSLSRAAGIGPVLHRWEKFYLNPHPTQKELEAMGQLIGLEVQRLAQMFPPKDVARVYRSTRLCGLCYKEAPYHRLSWLFRATEGCDKHQLRLISRCPACDEKIALPVEWEPGQCKRCGMKFTSMAKRQKPY
jgi:hypothetical protein